MIAIANIDLRSCDTPLHNVQKARGADAMGISQLGYIGFRVSDTDRWGTFLTEGLGMMDAGFVGGSHRYRNDALSWRVSVESGAEDDVSFLGFEVSGQAVFETLKRKLADDGIAVEEGTAELKRLRNVLDLFTCADPEGLRIEIFYGPGESDEAPFISPAGVCGFLTGEQGLGHVLLTATDMDATRAFYRDALDFRLSDMIILEIGQSQPLPLEFYHCNNRHHTVAFLPLKGPKRMQHFMLQVLDLDEVGYAQDRMDTVGAAISLSIGRHSNDKMISFYAQTPSGFDVEFGFGALDVDDSTWRVTTHSRTSLWGHKTPGSLSENWKPEI
ncbi:VOC family protein [Sphingobium indicum]|nr:VOC family protein [Sphingobium indicum]